MAATDVPLSAIKPVFLATTPRPAEPPACQMTIDSLKLRSHPEGGYFVETDRDPWRVPNPFLGWDYVHQPNSATTAEQRDRSTRSASTSIFYLITPASPFGSLHRNRARTVHTLHRGRGRYVIIHADEARLGEKARIESFLVGPNVTAGEKLQWIVEGGKFKASYLLPDKDESVGSDGLLISEVIR